MKAKTLYWLPRILTMLAILFMLMFSFDVFEGNEPLGRKLVGFFMHNIPVLILTGILVIAWIWEITGGVILILASIGASIFFRAFSGNPYSLILTVPFLITGVLFILHRVYYGKSPEQNVPVQ